MAAKYSDADISRLLAERKPLDKDFISQVRMRGKRGHKEQELDIQGVSGNQFCLILRQSSFNVLDFSIILAHCPADTNQLFRLRRYKGKSHEHTNKIESDTFYDFHIHRPRSDTRNSALGKMLLRSRQIGFPISTPR